MAPSGSPAKVRRSIGQALGGMARRHPAAAGVLLALAILTGSWIVLHGWPAWRDDCDVRLSPYVVNVEIQGWGAGSQCERLLAGPSRAGYQESSPDGPTICERTYDGYEVKVRDPSGIVGTLVCASLPPASRGIEAFLR